VTVTGSIGVISAWVWDSGFGAKTGMTADGVQRGSHADLYAGIRLPLVGLRLPTRNLDEKEKALVREGTMKLYDDFVGAVAEGRDLPDGRVRELGEGRVWMGEDAVERGLCDEIGSLPDAIAKARALGGVDPDDEVLIEEFPPRRRFRLPVPELPGISLFGGDAPARDEPEEDYAWRYVRMLAERPGAPMLLVPPEEIPAAWAE
jgi:protease-4